MNPPFQPRKSVSQIYDEECLKIKKDLETRKWETPSQLFAPASKFDWKIEPTKLSSHTLRSGLPLLP